MSNTIKIANASIHDIATAFANSSAVITLIVPLFIDTIKRGTPIVGASLHYLLNACGCYLIPVKALKAV